MQNTSLENKFAQNAIPYILVKKIWRKKIKIGSSAKIFTQYAKRSSEIDMKFIQWYQKWDNL